MADQPETPTPLQAAQNQPATQIGEGPQALKAWWTGFKKKTKKEQNQVIPAVEVPPGIFGVDLHISIKYANVAISLMNENGESFIYGYVPIVVAKCGVFLKEKATDVQGIFRLSGSNKRIKELQNIFDSPDRYGKGLDWTGYTVHDAANILRRYLNKLPQPIIPLDFYERFRDPLRSHQTQAVGDMEAQAQDIGDFDQGTAIATYQQLITELPPLNRQLLLYILDLLSVFASKSDINLMTSANLSAIFQPGLLSHPHHDMSPQEYRLSQDVLIFLIDNQDNFLIGMRGTAADENTVREVQNGAQPYQPSTPNSARGSQIGLGRSTSNASAGADSLRKFGGIRRNVSVSSKNSRKSTNVPSPITPSSGTPFASNNTGSGVYRSNTVPSKKSPGLSTSRFNRALDSPSSPHLHGNQVNASGHATPPSATLAPSTSELRHASTSSSITPTAEHPIGLPPIQNTVVRHQSKERLISNEQSDAQEIPPGEESRASGVTPVKGRNFSSLLNKSPIDADRKDGRQPNKLKKKRIPSSANPSAHSSTNSLNNTPESVYATPMPTPGFGPQVQSDPMGVMTPSVFNTAATPESDTGPRFGDGTDDPRTPVPAPNSTLRPAKSPSPSTHSKSSVTDHSEADHSDDKATTTGNPVKKHRWRFSSSAKKYGQSTPAPSISPSHIGSNTIAEKSVSSVTSFGQARRSMTNDTQQTVMELSSTGYSTTSVQQLSSNDSPPKEKDSQEVSEKKGPIGWIKARVAQAKEDRREREAEKDRTKSPPRTSDGRSGSKPSLPVKALETVPRDRSIDVRREERNDTTIDTSPPASNANVLS
ncbi:hypothetical protein MMC26_006185 [Xylographa opegraphella]|nr:hypothetical protein [Xylographa opegraphella]